MCPVDFYTASRPSADFPRAGPWVLPLLCDDSISFWPSLFYEFGRSGLCKDCTQRWSGRVAFSSVWVIVTHGMDLEPVNNRNISHSSSGKSPRSKCQGEEEGWYLASSCHLARQAELSCCVVSLGKGGISFRVSCSILLHEGCAYCNHLAKAIAPVAAIADVRPEFESGER